MHAKRIIIIPIKTQNHQYFIVMLEFVVEYIHCMQHPSMGLIAATLISI